MRVIPVPRWPITAICALVAVVAVLVLVGWMFGVPDLTTLRTSAVPMKANVALAFIGSVGAVLLLARPRETPLWSVLGATLGTVVLVTGVLTLLSRAGYALPFELDGWLFPDTADPRVHLVPWTNAVAFMALGSAFVLTAVRREWARGLAQMLAAGVAFVGLLTIFGFAVDYPAGAIDPVQTSLHGGVSFFAVGIATVTLHPEARPAALVLADDQGGRLVRRLLPAVVLIPLTIGFLLGDRLEARPNAFGALLFAASSIILLVVVVVATGASVSRASAVRQRAEDALRVNAQIVSELPIGLEVWRLEPGPATGPPVARLVASNPGAAVATGVPRHEVLGKRMDEVPYALYMSRIRDALLQVSETRRPMQIGEIALRTTNAPPKVLWAAAFPLPDGSIGVSLEDVTMRRIAEQQRSATEEELRRTAALLDAMLENMPAMVFLKDANDLRFARVNRAATQILGVAKEAIVGRDDFALFRNDEASAFRASDRATLDAMKLVDIPAEPLHTAAGLRWLHTRKVPIVDDQQRPRFVLGVSEDITARRAAEAELQAAKDAAEAANRELEAFSYSVAHDLRAPLRTIDGFSLALIEDHAAELGAEGRRYLSFVREAAQRMAQLIEDLLKLARITRQQLAREDVDFSALAEVALARLHQADPERKVVSEVEPELPASADPRLLAIVLDNLIGNAWKFTAKRPDARIVIGAEESDEGPIVYHVKDNGAGFDMAYADKLFGVFQRLHSPEEFAGTGIGLATVQRIVRRHGGWIRAEGAVGQGAAFYFTLEPPEPDDA